MLRSGLLSIWHDVAFGKKSAKADGVCQKHSTQAKELQPFFPCACMSPQNKQTQPTLTKQSEVGCENQLRPWMASDAYEAVGSLR